MESVVCIWKERMGAHCVRWDMALCVRVWSGMRLVSVSASRGLKGDVLRSTELRIKMVSERIMSIYSLPTCTRMLVAK